MAQPTPPLDLPITPVLPQIAQTVADNPATVIIGATGSGKTTQVGLHLLRQGLAGDLRIGVTQPRRIAATSVAEYVAELYGCDVGQEVGYQIRFDDSTMEGTKLKFMTDGILLQEASFDPLFSRYSVLIFDEAHEQGLNTDIGLGLAKRAMAQRPDLKVIIMSATIDTGRFSDYLNNAPIITVPGRSFPIQTRFLQPQDYEPAAHMFAEDANEPSLPALAAYFVNQIHTNKLESSTSPTDNERQASDVQRPEKEAARQQGSKAALDQDGALAISQPRYLAASVGHILIFMPGKKEIAQTIEYISDMGLPDLLPLPAHSEMDQSEQQRIFEPSEQRKVVVATNIAETSITVPGLAFVIDSGLIREMTFNHKYGIGSLRTIEHSKAGLRQRQGRAGRTQPGTYIALYTETEFDTGRPGYLEQSQTQRPEYSTPEIQREDLAGAILRMSQLGISDIEHFDFMNAPSSQAIHHALVSLNILGALDKDWRITDLGKQMVTLPVEPRISRMLLEAENFSCVAEILTICACLSTGTIFLRPIGEELPADQAKAALEDKRGDLFTLLKILPMYLKQPSANREAWAAANYLNHHTLHEITLIREQLENLVTQLNIPITSLQDSKYPKTQESKQVPNFNFQTPNFERQQKGKSRNSRLDLRYSVIGQAITAGLLQNLAVKTSEHDYTRADGTTMRIHPASVWADRKPPIIVCTEILEINNSTYAVNVQAVELDWLEHLAPQIFGTRQETLKHPWKGNVIGTYTITTINNIEISRQYSGKRLPQHLVNQDRRQHQKHFKHDHHHKRR